MKTNTRILLIHIFFCIIAIIALVRCLFFDVSFMWFLLILIIWIVNWVSIEKIRRGMYHERLNKRKKRR